ncbi:MAG: type II secretion system assembly factor GspB [Plesiomonas shigelloides]
MSTLLRALIRAQQPYQAQYITGMGLPTPWLEQKNFCHVSWLLAPLALLLGAATNYGWHLIHLHPIKEEVEVKKIITPAFVRIEPVPRITRPLPPAFPESIDKGHVIKVRKIKINNRSSSSKVLPTLAEQLQEALNETPLREESNYQSSITPSTKLMALLNAPFSIKEKVPDLNYESHIFSSNNAKRIVILNGNTFREGNEIAPGVFLSDIKQQYIVLDINGQYFTIKALQDWHKARL